MFSAAAIAQQSDIPDNLPGEYHFASGKSETIIAFKMDNGEFIAEVVNTVGGDRFILRREAETELAFVPIGEGSRLSFTFKRNNGIWLCSLRVGDKLYKGQKPSDQFNGFVITREQALADLKQLEDLLGRHPAIERTMGENWLDSAIHNTTQQLPAELTLRKFASMLSRLTAQLKCGHTTITLPQEKYINSKLPLVPFTIRIADGTVFVKQYFHDSGELDAGYRLESINGYQTGSIVSSISEMIPADGGSNAGKRARIENSFPVYYATLFEDASEFIVRFVDKTGAVRECTLPPASVKEYAASIKTSDPLEFTLNEDAHYAILKISHFDFYSKREEFKDFVDTSFARIQRHKVENLVVDVRNNMGGDPFCSSYLLSFLIDKPFAYFAEPYERFENLSTDVQPQKNTFNGNLYVLMNGGCFSTCGHFLALLKHHSKGRLAGSVSEGGFMNYGGAGYHKLMNSSIRVSVPTRTTKAAVDSQAEFSGVTPDILIEPRINDLISGKDTVLEHILTLIDEDSKKCFF